MRDKLKIDFVNIYYEEKNAKSNNVHYWIMPKTEKINSKYKLYELDMKSYLESFSLKENKNKISKYNKIIRNELEISNYKRIDNELYNQFEILEKKINLCISNRCFIRCKGCYNNFCKEKEEISGVIIKEISERLNFLSIF